jgi:outer membrane lipoprotein-sorting protein
MKKVVRISIISACLGIVFSAVSVSESRAQGVLSEILRRMDVYNKSLQSLKADLTMVKTNTQLNISDTTTGSTSYLPKSAKTKNLMYVRIDWTKPVDEQISVIGDKYELYRPRLGQVIQGQTTKAKNNASVGGALGFMSMSKDQLKANYDVVYIGEEQISGGVKTWHLQLNPRTPTSYKTAELWVDADGTPRQAKITENNGDSTTVLISNIQKNATIKADIFKLAYDKKKVKIIQA